jgi:hypothetical protein
LIKITVLENYSINSPWFKTNAPSDQTRQPPNSGGGDFIIPFKIMNLSESKLKAKFSDIDDVTDKVQTPDKVQTVADKVQIVSAHLQCAPCWRQFALCGMSPQSRVAQLCPNTPIHHTNKVCQNANHN